MKQFQHQKGNGPTYDDGLIDEISAGCLFLTGILIAVIFAGFLLIAKGARRQVKMEEDIEQLKSRDQPGVDYRQRAEYRAVFPVREWPATHRG